MDQVKGSTDEGGSREPYGPRDGFDEAHERRDARDRPGTTLDLKGILLDHKKTMGTTLMQLRCLYVVLALLAFFVPWPRNMGLSRTALYESLR